MMTNTIVPQTVAFVKNLSTSGANILTIIPRSKQPVAEWKHLTTTRQDKESLTVFLAALERGRADRLAIVHYGGWVAIDLDARDHASIASNAPAIPEETLRAVLGVLGLPDDYPWAGRSGGGRGFHVWLRCPDAPRPAKGGVDTYLPRATLPGSETIAAIEVRYANHMTCFPRDAYGLLEKPFTLPVETSFRELKERLSAVCAPKALTLPLDPPRARGDWFDEVHSALDRAYDARTLAQVFARHLGGDVQEERGAYRVTGHGGLLVTDKDGTAVWYNHTNGKGGGWAKGLALAFYGADAVPEGKDYIAFLERAAQEVNVSLPSQTPSPAPARAREAGETARGGGTAWAYTPIKPEAPPSFPLNAFPPKAQCYAREVAASCEAAVEIVAQYMLGVTGVCMQRRVTVLAHGGREEDTNIWAAIIAESGERKTSALKHVVEPLDAYVVGKKSDYAQRHRKAVAELNKMKRRIKTLEEETRKGKANGDAEDELTALTIDVMDAEANLPPLELSLYSSDITMEGLVGQLDKYGGRYAILASEPRMFEALRQYSRTGAIPLTALVEAYDNGVMKVTRAGREATRANIVRPRVSLTIAFQPQTFVSLLRRNENLHSGFLARFVWSLAPSLAGRRTFNTPRVSDEAKTWWRNLVVGLLDADLDGLLLTLDDKAAEMVRELNCAYDARSAPGGEMYRIRDWAARAGTHALRIAAALHAMKHGKGILDKQEIDPETMKAAITLVRDYYTRQARAVYDMFERTPETVDGEKLRVAEAALRDWGGDTFTVRELYAKLRRYFRETNDLRVFVRKFEEHGYIRRLERIAPGRGRPSDAYEINPAIRTDAIPASPDASYQEPPEVAQDAPRTRQDAPGSATETPAMATFDVAPVDAQRTVLRNIAPDEAPPTAQNGAHAMPAEDVALEAAIAAMCAEAPAWGAAVDAYARAAGLRRLEALKRIAFTLNARGLASIADEIETEAISLARLPDDTPWLRVLNNAVETGAWDWGSGCAPWTDVIALTRAIRDPDAAATPLEHASLADLITLVFLHCADDNAPTP